MSDNPVTMPVFTAAEEARIRELLIVHTIGSKIGGLRQRRHYELFYLGCEQRRAELEAASAADRDRLLAEIGEEADAQEWAECQAAERAVDPEGLTSVERLNRGFTAFLEAEVFS